MFDPYHKWLGIPKDQRPPTHYQLLGVVPDEKDPEVIEEAAVRQTTHIRAYQIGPQAGEGPKQNPVNPPPVKPAVENPGKGNNDPPKVIVENPMPMVDPNPPPPPPPVGRDAFEMKRLGAGAGVESLVWSREQDLVLT